MKIAVLGLGPLRPLARRDEPTSAPETPPENPPTRTPATPLDAEFTGFEAALPEGFDPVDHGWTLLPNREPRHANSPASHATWGRGDIDLVYRVVPREILVDARAETRNGRVYWYTAPDLPDVMYETALVAQIMRDSLERRTRESVTDN